MGYRRNNTPPPKPENHLKRFEVRNGAIMELAFPCFYVDVLPVHDSHYHDYIGWPDPHTPGIACQHLPHIPTQYFPGEFEYFDMEHPHPIEFAGDYEGYDFAAIVFDNPVKELTATAWLDTDEKNVVRVRVKAAFNTFNDKPKDFRFTLFVHAPSRTYEGRTEAERIDQVFRGAITVLPGPKI